MARHNPPVLDEDEEESSGCHNNHNIFLSTARTGSRDTGGDRWHDDNALHVERMLRGINKNATDDCSATLCQ